MNPFFMQIGIIEPDNVFEALKDYLQALGRRDYSRFIKKSNLQSSRVLTAAEELRRLLAGKKIDVMPEMEHEAFIKLADALAEQEGVEQLYSSDSLNAVSSQKEQHQAMLESMQAQAGQIQQAQQQMFNGMGPGGGIAPGSPPLLPNNGMNAYNDFQIGRSNLNQSIQANSGQQVPGMANPKQTQ